LDSTRNTGKASVSVDAWLGLLSELSDEELTKYGEIAKDQCDLERQNPWAQVISGGAALLALMLGAREVIQNGITNLFVIYTVLAGIPGFWLMQKLRMRWFWNKHCSAVEREKMRRAVTTDCKVE